MSANSKLSSSAKKSEVKQILSKRIPNTHPLKIDKNSSKTSHSELQHGRKEIIKKVNSTKNLATKNFRSSTKIKTKKKQFKPSTNKITVQDEKSSSNNLGNISSLLTKIADTSSTADNSLLSSSNDNLSCPSPSSSASSNPSSPNQSCSATDLLPAFKSLLAPNQLRTTSINKGFQHLNENDESQLNIFQTQSQDQESINIRDVINTLGDGEAFGDLRYQLEMLTDNNAIPDVKELPGLAQQEKEESAVQYKNTKHQIKHWLPLIQSIKNSNQLEFGHTKIEHTPHIQNIGQTFKAEDDFEKEIDSALEKCEIDQKNITNSKEFGPIEQIKETLQRDQAAHLKALMFREHRKKKMLSKIKSKTWHKIHKKSEQRDKEKLMNRLEIENPELASKLRLEFEEKYATQRLQRRQMARHRWSKTAFRFGGREMQPVISAQKQKEYDDKKSVEQVVKSRPFGMEITNSETENDSDDQDNPQYKDSPKIAYKTKLQAMRELKESEDPLPNKGIFALKFMRDAIEKQRSEINNATNEFMEALNNAKFTQDSLLDSNDEYILSTDKPKDEKCLPKFSKAELDHAKTQVAEQLKQRPDVYIESDEKITLLSTETLTTKTTSYAPPNTSSLSSTLLIQPEKYISENKKPTKSSSAEKHLQMEELLNQITPDINDEQRKLISEIFVSGNSNQEQFATEFKNNELSNTDNTTKNSDQLLGWGNWTGEGITPKKSKQKKQETSIKSSKYLSSIIINKSIDQKASKFQINNIPYPYRSTEDYKIQFQHPIGREWNSFSAHKAFIQPKVKKQLGTPINPLQLSKKPNTSQLDTFVRNWNKDRIANRTKTRL